MVGSNHFIHAAGLLMHKELSYFGKVLSNHLPVDYVCADKFSPTTNILYSDDKIGIPEKYMGLDWKQISG